MTTSCTSATWRADFTKTKLRLCSWNSTYPKPSIRCGGITFWPCCKKVASHLIGGTGLPRSSPLPLQGSCSMAFHSTIFNTVGGYVKGILFPRYSLSWPLIHFRGYSLELRTWPSSASCEGGRQGFGHLYMRMMRQFSSNRTEWTSQIWHYYYTIFIKPDRMDILIAES